MGYVLLALIFLMSRKRPAVPQATDAENPPPARVRGPRGVGDAEIEMTPLSVNEETDARFYQLWPQFVTSTPGGGVSFIKLDSRDPQQAVYIKSWLAIRRDVIRDRARQS